MRELKNFFVRVHKTKTKAITTANQSTGNYYKEPMRIENENKKALSAGEHW